MRDENNKVKVRKLGNARQQEMETERTSLRVRVLHVQLEVVGGRELLLLAHERLELAQRETDALEADRRVVER